MKEVLVYKSSNGILEETRERAYAWELHHKLGRLKDTDVGVGFSECLKIIMNKDEVMSILNEYEGE